MPHAIQATPPTHNKTFQVHREGRNLKCRERSYNRCVHLKNERLEAIQVIPTAT